ncbi:MAG: hypothetical protein J0L99_04040 [Chitinophagales bacterium]|nr:hypothetical protein [Chitinophagales bacterium]
MPVAGAQAVFLAGKTAVHRYAGGQLKVDVSVVGIGGIIRPGLHPDFIARLRSCHCSMQVGESVGPGVTGVGAGGILGNVNALLGISD